MLLLVRFRGLLVNDVMFGNILAVVRKWQQCVTKLFSIVVNKYRLIFPPPIPIN